MAQAVGKQVTVISYNLLAPMLCTQDRFTTSHQSNLTPHLRLEKIFTKLEPHVKDNAIICLQEVSMSWGGTLHSWFQQRGYTFVPTFYGSTYSDYMGVGLAYPTGRFKELGLDIKRVSEVAKPPRGPRRSRAAAADATWSEWVAQKGGQVHKAYMALMGKSPQKPTQTHWEAARYRYNRMISVTLEPVDGGCPFTVATYHMPCAFYDPPLMSLHAAWCAEHALAVAGNAPLVLCGDFNLKPPDPGYELLTTGVLSKEADWPAYPEVPDAPWRIGQNKPLVSAYAQVQGKEPQYTNWAHEPGKDEFIDCLDYLLSSPELTPVSVIELPKRADADGPYPSVTEPSDHLLIGATYTLPSSL